MTLGFSIVLLSIHLTHFFAPVSIGLYIVLAGVGIFVFFQKKLHLELLSIRNAINPSKLLLFLFLLLGGRILYEGSFPVDWYDSLLYHIPFTKLYVYNHLIPGIALVHSRFGFTSSTFSVSSLHTLLPGNDQSFTIMNTMYALWICCAVFLAFVKKNIRSLSQMTVLTFAAVTAFCINGMSLIPTLAPELGVFFWLLVAVLFFLEKNYAFAFLASILAFATKSSAFLFVGIFFVALLYYKAFSQKIVLLLASLLCIVFFITSSIQTGYLLFPVESTYAPLLSGSALPKEDVRELRSTIYSWARFSPYTDRIEPESAWFVRKFLPTIPPSVQLVVLLICLTFLHSLIVRTFNIHEKKPLVFLVVSFWTVTVLAYSQAPDLRLLWPFGTLSLGVLAAAAFSNETTRFIPTLSLLLLVASSLYLAIPSRLPLRKSQALFPVETVYNFTASKRLYKDLFSYTTPVSGDDRCGTAHPLCIPDETVLSHFSYQTSPAGLLQSISRK